MDSKKRVKKFSVSMPVEAYDYYQKKAEAAGLSISQFLYRAGSITTIEQAVMFPLNHKVDTMGAVPISEQQKIISENQQKNK